MDSSEQARFDRLYAQHLRALTRQGKAPKTIDAYARALRRVPTHFDRCPDRLDAEDFKSYFADLIRSHSWSLVKIERCALQFFFVHVLEREWAWVDMLKPPVVKSLPDVLTVDDIARLLLATRERRYQIFWLTAYSLGLRLGETLRLQVGDIDADRGQVHIRDGKGRKDRFVTLPSLTLHCLRRIHCRARPLLVLVQLVLRVHLPPPLARSRPPLCCPHGRTPMRVVAFTSRRRPDS